MAQFTVNTHRFDPYKNFKFRVKWDGRYVAGVSKVGSLKRSTEVVEHREGGDPSTSRKSPGRTKFRRLHSNGVSRTIRPSNNGRTRSGISAQAWVRKCRSRISGKTSSSNSTTRPDN